MKLCGLFFFLLVFNLACIKEDSTLPVSVHDDPDERPVRAPDPLASYAWHLKNTGQTSFALHSGSASQDISLDGTFARSVTGAGVKIAISDSGTDIDHPDLIGSQAVGLHRNYSSTLASSWRSGLPWVTDNDAHGTAVAGLSSAEGWNGIGSRGVAPGSKFGAFKFITSYTGAVTQTSLTARAVDQTDGAFDIFNFSYGYAECIFYDESPLILSALEKGVTNLRQKKGAIYVQAAGNGYRNTINDCLDISSSAGIFSPYQLHQ